MAEAPSASPESRASIETLLARIVARLDSMDARLDSIEKRFEGRLDAIEKRSNVLIGLWAAVIVVLITTDGLMWNAIVTGERSLGHDIAQLGERLDGRIAQLDNRMTDLERGLVERIHNLELAFVRSGIVLQPGNPAPNGEQRSERDVSPGAGPAEPEAARPDQAE